MNAPSFSWTPEPEWSDAIRLLLRAARYAEVAGQPYSKFAVEYRRLCDAGAEIEGLRLLVTLGVLTHWVDLTLMGQQGRLLDQISTVVFSEKSCFAVSEWGRAVLQDWLDGAADEFVGNGQSGQSSIPNRSELSNRLGCRPEWNGDRHELRWRGELVKAYRKPAPHQERILAVFEEEGWPVRIDDPLPASGGCSPKQRLHSTIQALNRNRRCKAIHFGGDGTGEGIYWEVATHAAGHLHRAPG